jgi:RNA polymerase sigma factor (sigma-70 family)
MEPKPAALLQIFQAERDRIFRLIRRIVRNPATAEDLTQDTLVHLWNRPVTGQDRNLVLRTAQNLAIDHLRRQQVRGSYAENVLPEQLQPLTVPPDEAVEQRAGLEAAMAALGNLPTRTQRVFLLNRLDGMTYAQIAKELDVSVSTVEKDMIRAIAACRALREGRR